MHEIQFIPAAWMALAAQNYPQRVIVFSRTAQVPDLPDVQQEQVFIQTPEKCKVPILAQIRPAA